MFAMFVCSGENANVKAADNGGCSHKIANQGIQSSSTVWVYLCRADTPGSAQGSGFKPGSASPGVRLSASAAASPVLCNPITTQQPDASASLDSSTALATCRRAHVGAQACVAPSGMPLSTVAPADACARGRGIDRYASLNTAPNQFKTLCHIGLLYICYVFAQP
eukprot:359744-Chlamydomonas_euryale.AAC.7